MAEYIDYFYGYRNIVLQTQLPSVMKLSAIFSMVIP